MIMTKRLFWLLLLTPILALGQNFMTVTGVTTYGTGGQLLTAGTLIFQPVDSSGNNIGYQVGGGGQQINFPTICSITNGVVVQPCQVANTSLTNPMNVCFSVSIKDSNNRVIIGGPQSGYTCVQPQTTNFWCAIGSCNFDQYVPNLPAAIMALLGPAKPNSLGGVYAEDCQGSFVMNGISVTGHPDCTPGGGGGGGGVQDPGGDGVMKRTALNVTAPALAADVIATLGFTPANNTSVVHLAGFETILGSKTFALPINGSLSGNASTASAFQNNPAVCNPGEAPRGIISTGDATGCFSLTAGLGDPGANGLIKRTAFNTTAPAIAGDVTATLGYTAANDANVAHVTGNETIGGTKIFSSTINGSITGNSGTTGAFNHSPTQCIAGNAPIGISSVGDSNGCAPLGIADPGSNGVLTRTALNTTGIAGPSDINGALGYTAANNTLVAHLAGLETFSGAKTFSSLITGSVSGNAGTSSALDHLPTPCSTGNAPTGILANGNSTGCASLGLADPGSNGLLKRTGLNVTAIAGAGDVNAALGYTTANDTLVAHLAGIETLTGAKTFSAALTANGAIAANAGVTTTTLTATTGITDGALTNRTGNYLSLSPAGNASPAGTLILDASSGYLQLQADSGAGANQGGALNLQSSNGPNAIAFASLLVGSSGIQINSAGMTIFSAGGLKTILTGPGITQFGNVGGTKGSVDFVGSTSGTRTVACADVTCTSLALTGPVTISGTPLGTASGGTGVTDLTFSGSTHKAVTTTGTLTLNDCVKIDASGNFIDAGAACGAGSGGLVDPGSNGVLKRTALNTTAIAGASDINGALGYTAANDTLAAHLAGIETFTGAKTFSTTITGNISGNAGGTASALASDPADCAANSAAIGINASGVAQGCFTPVLLGADLGNTVAAPRVLSTHISAATLNTVMKANSTGNMVNSTITDDGSLVSISAVNGVSFGGGGAAGFDGYGFGTAQSVAANTFGITAPTSGTAHNLVLPGSPTSGFLKVSTTVSPTGCTASSTILCGTYSNINLAADVTGILPPLNGGLGVASPTAHGLLIGEGTSAVSSLIGNTGYVLIGQGASSDPIFSATLTLGTNFIAPVTGGLSLCGNVGGCATIKPQSSFTNFEFDLPVTAGASGSPLLSAGGAGSPMTWGTRSGNTTTFVTTTGALTLNDCVKIDANDNFVDAGAGCGGGGGGGVGAGTSPRLAYYDTGTTVASAANTAFGDGTANAVISLTGTSLAKESLLINCTTPTNNCLSFQIGGANRFFMDSAGNMNVNGTLKAGGSFIYQNQSPTQNTTFSSGTDTNASQGGSTFRSGDMTGNGANTVDATTLRGGNCTGTGACSSGDLVIGPGELTNAAPNASAVEGKVIFNSAAFRKGTTVTTGNLACITSDNTIGDCSTAAANVKFVGVHSTTTGGSSLVQSAGTQTLNLAASSTWAAGDFVCSSATSAAQMYMNGTLACPAYSRRVGFAIAGGTASTTVKTLLQFGQLSRTIAAVATGQTAAITTTTLVTAPSANSLFEIGGALTCDTSVATATATLTISWTDTSNTAQSVVTSAAVCTTLGVSSFQSVDGKRINVKGGTNISYAVAIANAPNYDVRVEATQITAN